MRLTALAVVAGLLLAACGGPISVPGLSMGPAPAELLGNALKAFLDAHTYAVKGTITDGTTDRKLNLQGTSAGDFKGTLDNAKGLSLEVVTATGSSFYRGEGAKSELDARSQTLAQGRWIRTATDPTAIVRKLLSTQELKLAFGGSRAGLKRTDSKVNGANFATLSDKLGTVTIPLFGAPYPSRLERTPAADVVDGIGALDLSFDSYNVDFSTQTPADFIDFNQPRTEPARYIAVASTFGFDQCDPRSCAAHVTYQNVNGSYEAVKPALATLTMTRGAATGPVIDACSTPIPYVSAGEKIVVTCTISSAAWRAFGQQSTSWGTFTVSNPLYD